MSVSRSETVLRLAKVINFSKKMDAIWFKAYIQLILHVLLKGRSTCSTYQARFTGHETLSLEK